MGKRILPVGKQNFKEIRQNGYVYVDKTRYAWELARTGLSYFLSRPRRFGKSLFITTLESYFSGEKDLFKGLYIEEKENARGDDAWTEYPVISFYLSGGDYNSPVGLADTLNNVLESCANKYHLDWNSISAVTLPVRFRNLIEQLYEKTGRKVVVLVDEYDKPLLSTMISNPEQEEKNRELYKGFFSVLKDMDGYLKFVFFTGVTKFTKVSIFSDLNQLIDISMDDEYSGICGITEDEMVSAFKPEIEKLSEAQNITREECIANLQKMYDGYHFSKYGVGVYNPFSLLNAFTKCDFGSYWFESGTPDILVKKLRQSKMPVYQLTDGVTAKESVLKDYRVDDPDPVPLFYQSGYLTICGYDSRFKNYTLRFPNDEVKYGFLDSLANDVLGANSNGKIPGINKPVSRNMQNDFIE
ncbi:MAG: AAA family ATPase [Lachnospiraceae bacterium]|nr:AAA family ATPase [Lachnospiraceae bacterium]